ncbi:hypothetical protein BFL34_00398 [Clavibacter michiganensis]|uniref:Uncharacterized protein n=1 Tax=Clavibacter michiganensis TaxID=28447 RepID=A0A251YCF1_9MICO|nr:hypothetical protein [Clavibacter michiganensis]OUE21927.1 hypothetical protein BFL34_00398 [Clavibacter michiganensis]
MKALSDRFQRASLGIVFLVLAATVFVVRTLIGPLLLDDALSPGRMISTLVSSLFIAGVMTFVIARQRRRSGGADTMAEVTTSLKSRQLPPDADPAAWIPALEWRRRQSRRSMWLMPVLVAVLVAMGVAAVVLSPGSPAGWIIVVVFLALGIVTVVQARRALPRIDDLLRQLRERDGADVRPGGHADAARQAPPSPAAGA